MCLGFVNNETDDFEIQVIKKRHGGQEKVITIDQIGSYT